MAVVDQQGDDLETADLLDMRTGEFLCPVCRRLGTALLPALALKPLISPKLPGQAMGHISALPHQATQQQAGATGAKALHCRSNNNNTNANDNPDYINSNNNVVMLRPIMIMMVLTTTIIVIKTSVK